MFGHRELSFDDYLSMLRRRLPVIIISAIVAPILTYLVTLVLPAQYTSKARILIEQPEVPPDMVRPLVSVRLDERLDLIRQQVLSGARLQPIIEHYGLYRGSKPDQMVTKMLSDIEVSLLTSQKNNERPIITGFTMEFTAANPKLAQQVCSDVTSLFLEENLHERQQALLGTTEFLDRQLQEAKQRLDEQDALLAQFKSKNMGQIPGGENADMNVLMSLNNQLAAVTEALYRAQQDKSYTETLLAQQVEQGDNNPTELAASLAKMQDQLVMLEARYTPDHPDVIKLKTDIAQLKKKLEETQLAKTSNVSDQKQDNTTPGPPAIQQLRYQIHQYEENIKSRMREQDRLQRQISTYQARLNLSPHVEEQYKQLTRDYQTAQDAYKDLLAKKDQAEMATDLERRQQGEQFRLVDPASYPTKPSFPDPLKFTLAGLGGGLVLGFAIGMVLELMDKSPRTSKDIEFYLQLPVLGVLPLVEEENSNGHRTARFWRRSKKPEVTSHQELNV